MKPQAVWISAFAVLATVTGCGGDAEPESIDGPYATVTVTQTVSSTPTSNPTAVSPQPVEPKIGDTQTTDLGEVTVYRVEFPASNPANQSIATDGTVPAVVDIKVCGNGTGTSDGYWFDASAFFVTDSDGRNYSFWNVQVGARDPNLTDVLPLMAPSASICRRGWLTFELPRATKIVSVDYGPYEGTPLTWTTRT